MNCAFSTQSLKNNRHGTTREFAQILVSSSLASGLEYVFWTFWLLGTRFFLSCCFPCNSPSRSSLEEKYAGGAKEVQEEMSRLKEEAGKAEREVEAVRRQYSELQASYRASFDALQSRYEARKRSRLLLLGRLI